MIKVTLSYNICPKQSHVINAGHVEPANAYAVAPGDDMQVLGPHMNGDDAQACTGGYTASCVGAGGGWVYVKIA